jgi:hypothetical protein
LNVLQRRFNRNFNETFTPRRRPSPYADIVMKRAFVLQLGPDTNPPGSFDGWIEEVDTGRELRFRSTKQLLEFLGECFRLAQQGDRQAQQWDEEEPSRR